jgi:cell division protein FtsI (penicillin-binding protein 3)
MHIALVAIGIALSLCAGRLIQLQGVDSSAYAALSAEQLTRTLPLLPSRGQITDRNGVVLASTQSAVAVTADPSLTGPNADRVADIILKYLDIERAELIANLTKPNTRFVYLKKKVPALTYGAIAKDLAAARLPGVYRESDPIRTYSGGSSAASVVGFVGADGKGLGGLELALDKELAGVEGKETYESAPNGNKIPLGESKITPARNGLNYQTTLDSEVQYVAEQALAAQVRSTRADSGIAIVVNVQTGEILALANSPTFDANRPGEADAEDRGNRAVSAPYEPGSVQKILTAAALMDSGVTVGGQPITPDTRVVVPNSLASGPLRIKDHWSHPELKALMRGVIARSSNIGTALLARQMDKAELIAYLKRFGLGAPTGIEIPGEAAGIVPGPNLADYTRDQLAFGQAISVTAVQEAAALAALVNGGTYHPPTVIKQAADSDGNPVDVPRRPSRQVVSAQTSAHIRDVMTAVVDANSKLKLDGYASMGKTGTAQLADSSCGCYKGYVTSYVGAAPIDKPQLLTYVVLTDPKGSNATGSGSAAPAVKEIMQYALPRYSVPPLDSKHKVKRLVYAGPDR